MSGKNKETDIEKLDRFVSTRDEDELKKLHIQKTIWFFAGAVMLIVTMFLPSDASFHSLYGNLVSVFLTLNIIGMVYVLYMLFQENRKHKIRKVVLKSQAPKYGFDKKFTYLAYEIFTVLMFLMLAEQCAIIALARDGYAIAGLCLMAVGAACVLVSRFILVKANCGYMELIEVGKKEEREEKAETADGSEESETAESGKKTEEKEENDDDFYSPPKE